MKKTGPFLLFLLIFCILAGCGNTDPYGPEQQLNSTDSTTDAVRTGILYADFSCGTTGMDAELIQEYPFTYMGPEKSPEELANEPSILTGLDFFVTAEETKDGWIVDWSTDSTLIANLDNRKQKEAFFFHDSDSMRWFMMDSLWRTLTGNLGTDKIYYTMDKGKELVFDPSFPTQVFPKDIPYMGSQFYLAHSNVIGDEMKDLFARTAGIWRLNGELGAPRIEMDGIGGFMIYTEDPSIEKAGYLGYVDEYGDGNLRYDMYSMEGEWIDSFFLDSDIQLHFGNYDGPIYFLDLHESAENIPNTYYDERTGFLLTYPNIFSAGASPDENGIANFYTLWNTRMLYWTDPNQDHLSPSEFRDNMNLTETMELMGNVVIAYGEIEDQYGDIVPVAYYWVVNPDSVANVIILCTDQTEVRYWYSQFQRQVFYIENASVSFESQGITGQDYQGYWMYENGFILQIVEMEWYLYEEGGKMLQSGPVEFDDDAAYLMNADGSSGGGRVIFDEVGNAFESGYPLTKLEEFPYGNSEE